MSRQGLLLLAVALFAAPWVASLGGDGWVRILVVASLYVLLALGLNIVVGYAGLLDLGYVAFYAVGAYLYALLASPHLAEVFGWSGPLVLMDGALSVLGLLVLCGLLAGAAGVLLGTPVLGLRGDYLAIVTLGFGEIIRIFLNNLNAPINITNGPQGITAIPPLVLWGHRLDEPLAVAGFDVSPLILTHTLLSVLVLLVVAACIRLERSPLGLAWRALREDELAAASLGVPIKAVKLKAFAIGASFGGVSGMLFASVQGFVSPESFVLMESVVIVAMVVLGGMGSIAGVILGAVLLYALPEVLRYAARPVQEALLGSEVIPAEALRMLLFGLALAFMMRWRPFGLLPANTVARGRQ